jgi:alpha-L-rhamnosidase
MKRRRESMVLQQRQRCLVRTFLRLRRPHKLTHLRTDDGSHRCVQVSLPAGLRFFVLLTLFFGHPGSLAFGTTPGDRPLNPALVASRWPAFWIAPANSPSTETGVYYFRREISITNVPSHYWVHVSADNRFLLHVNSKYVAEGPARGDLFHWRFETVDLAPFLTSGKNVVAALVWSFGELAPVAQMSSRTGFLMQGDTDAEAVINTGRDWLVREEPGRTALGHSGIRGYYAAGPAERVDGRLLDWDWDRDNEAPSGWQSPRLLGHAAAREAQDSPNSWELVQDYLPAMEHRMVSAGAPVRIDGLESLPAFPSAPVTIPPNSHVKLLLDHHELQTAYPELTVSGGRDAEINLTYSEALYDAQGKKGNRNEIAKRHIEGITDQFFADGGNGRKFEPLWWRAWRYLQIEVITKDQPLKLDSMGAWFSAYPFEAKATIDADIPQLDRLWQTGWRTARLGAHETYMDAPYWEQLQYVGDTRIQALISYVVTGDHRLPRQAIENLDDSRTPEGITQSRYPSGLPQFIPTFSLLWVNMLHDYWMYVDDLPTVKHVLPHTRTVLDWYANHLREDGLLGRMNWWQFADWTAGYTYGVPPQESDGRSTFLTLEFIGALQDAAEMESQYGSQERVRDYQAIIRKASDALNRQNWDPERGVYADTPSKKFWSKDANILAVLLDVPPSDQRQQILKRVLVAMPNESATLEGKLIPPMSEPSYYFRFYLSRALDHAGLGDLYIGQLQPWYNMLNLGLSTWAETPEPTRSDSHAWSASPNYDLLTIVAGIRPMSPGFKRVRIAPHLEGLHHLEASMPVPQGLILATFKQEGDRWVATLTLPAGLDGEFSWKDKTYSLHSGTQTLALP